MANNFSGRPWILDTPGVITTDRVRVGKIRWDAEGASAGDNVVLSRADGRVFWSATASAANFTTESDQFDGLAGDCQGMTLTTINSGKLYVYCS